MITQIRAKPDRNGIIRVACGTDVIEIIVWPGGGFWGWDGGGGPDGGGGDGPTPTPTGDGEQGSGPTGRGDEGEGTPSQQGNAPSAIDTPHILYVHPNLSGEIELSNKLVLDRFHAELASDRPNPTGVVLALEGAADVHAVADLSSQLREATPGLDIALDFGFETENG